MKPVDPKTLVHGDILHIFDPDTKELQTNVKADNHLLARLLTSDTSNEVYLVRHSLPQTLGSIVAYTYSYEDFKGNPAQDHYRAVRVSLEPDLHTPKDPTPTSYQWLSYDFYGNARPMSSQQLSEYDWTIHQP